ncbi:hypothetical protein EJB05_34855, partial [Eragrostis curvula]
MMAEPGVSDWRISTRRGVRHSCPRPEIRAAAPRGTAWIHCRVQAHHYDLQPTAAARTKLVKKSEDKAVNRRGTSGFSQSWTSTLQSSKVTSEADIVSNDGPQGQPPLQVSLWRRVWVPAATKQDL